MDNLMWNHLIVSGLLSCLVRQGLTEDDISGKRLRHGEYKCYGDRPVLDNGYYEVLREDGHVIKAHCNPGFLLVGTSLRICDYIQEKFLGDDPVCQDIDECVAIGNDTMGEDGSTMVTMATDDTDNGPLPCHHLATCVNSLGSYQCQCNLPYVGDGYTCHESSLNCPSLDPPEFGFMKHVSSDSVKFYCHPDYSVYGQSLLHCHHGNWSSHVPKCIKGWKSCGDPGVPDNGYRRGNRFSVGAVVRFYCRKDFRINGPRLRRCEGSQTWTSQQPTCKNISKNMKKDSTENEKNLDRTVDLITPPWLAKISMATHIRSTVAPSCEGGVICNGKWVITAATCLRRKVPNTNMIEWLEPSDLVVTIGGKQHRVSKIGQHPGSVFDEDFMDKNIGFLKLNVPANVSKSLCLFGSKNETLQISYPHSDINITSCENQTNKSLICTNGTESFKAGTPLVTTSGHCDHIIGLASQHQTRMYVSVTSHLPWISRVTGNCAGIRSQLVHQIINNKFAYKSKHGL